MAKIKFQGFGSFGGSLEGRVVSQSKEKGTAMIVVTASAPGIKLYSSTFHLRRKLGTFCDSVGRCWEVNGKVATSNGLTPMPPAPAAPKEEIDTKTVIAAVAAVIGIEKLVDLLMEDDDLHQASL